MPVNHAIPLRDFWSTAEVEPGRWRHERKFGAPRRQHDEETIWLVGDVAAAGSLLVNGQIAGMVTAGHFEFEVTAMLMPRNTVMLDAHSSEPPVNVMVEIRRE
jgi:hypothetical protein